MTKSRGIYRRPAIDRLLERAVPDPATGCLVWPGGVNHGGYARIYDYTVRKYVTTHRLAYIHAKGPVPDGLQLDHLCRNTRCVNADHLEAVTPAENLRRKPPITHCPQGHEYTPENTYMRPDRPAKMCRICTRDASRRYIERKRAARDVYFGRDVVSAEAAAMALCDVTNP